MHEIEVSREMGHSAERVWALLDDFSNTWVFHPLVEHSASVNGVERGEGAQRYCRMYGGKQVEERVTERDASRRWFRVEVVEHGPFPMEHMAVEIRVEDLGGGRSRAVFAAEFVMKYGALGRAMGALMMERRLGAMLGSVLDGADAYLETGRVVGKGGVLLEPVLAAA